MPFPQRPYTIAILALLLHSANSFLRRLPYLPTMLPKIIPYTSNTISTTPPTRPTKPSSHPTKTLLKSPGLQLLPFILQASRSNAGSAMLQPAPHVRALLSITVSKALANRAPMADASRQPDYAFNLTAPASESDFPVDLVAYQEYSPCQSILQDYDISNISHGSGSTKNNSNPVFSNIFAISVQNQSAGVTWSVESSAVYRWYMRRNIEGRGWSEGYIGHTRAW